MKEKNYQLKKTFWYLLFIINTILFIIAFFCILNWYYESINLKGQINALQAAYYHPVLEESNLEPDTILDYSTDILPYNPYLEYQKLATIDFDELKTINQDIQGWLTIKGTNINYPFVQTTNNTYYLKHDINKNYNTGGWLFLDYRNNLTTLNQNNIIYGHNRKDQTMFGSLANIFTSKWLNNHHNFYLELSTINYDSVWQVFSTYHLPITSDYLQVSFTEQGFLNFLNLITNRSIHHFKVDVHVNDKILTLSTCYKNNERTVLHAKLINLKNHK